MLIISTKTSSWIRRETKEAAKPPQTVARAGVPEVSETVDSCLKIVHFVVLND